MKTLVLITILALTLVINVPNLSKPGAATAPPEGNGLTLTVYPDRSVGISAQMYNSSVTYTKNVNLQHSADLSEDNSSGILNDVFPSYPTFVGRNVTFQWNAPGGQFNHTLTVRGPNGFAQTLTIYPNPNGSSRPYAQIQLTIAGNYYFNSTAVTTLPHTSSVLYPLTVVAAEENEPPTVNYSGSLSKQTGYVSFTQTGSVVLSPFLKASIPFPFNLTDSVSVSGSYQNGQHSGTITIHALSGATFPLNDLNLPYTVNSTYTVLRGNVTVLFNSAYPTPFENSTIFSKFFDATFGNYTWNNINIIKPLNSTTGGKIQVSKFNVTAAYTATSGLISFNVVLKGDLVRWFFFGPFVSTPTKLTKVYNDTLTLWTSTTYTLTYTRSSGTVNLQATSHLVPDLDTKFNDIKSEFLNYTNATNTPQGLFLNKTIVLISSLTAQVTMTPTTSWVQVSGIVLQPPTVPATNGFEEYGLFNYTGYMSTKVNFTLIGGSNATNYVNIQIPAGVPTPTTSSPTMDTWWNFQNFTKLAPIVFSVAIQTASAPTNLVPAAGNAMVTLTWSPPSNVGGGIQNYRVYRGISSGGEALLTTASSTTFTDTGLTNGQVYYYEVSAMTGGGEGPLTSEVSATPSAPLIDISENPFTLHTNSTILNWTYNSTSGVASFQVSGNLGVGSLRITVPKTLVPYANNVTITFDGTVVTPAVTSDASNFYFTLTPYQYTTHTVKIVLALATTTTSATTPFPWLIVGAVLVIIILAGGGVYWYSRRKSNLKMPSAASTPTPTRP